MAPLSPPSAASTAAAILGGLHHHHYLQQQSGTHGASNGSVSSQGASNPSASAANGSGTASTGPHRDREGRAVTPVSSITCETPSRSRSSSFGSQHAAGALHSLASAHNHHHQHHQHQHQHHNLHGPSHLNEQQAFEEPTTPAAMTEKRIPSGPGSNVSEASFSGPSSVTAQSSKLPSTPSSASGKASPEKQSKGTAKHPASGPVAGPFTAGVAQRSAAMEMSESNAGDVYLYSSSSPAPGDGKRPRKKKTNRACHHCQKAHLTCDESRPCQRCIKKGLADTCHDGTRKKAKYLLEDDELDKQEALRQRNEHSAGRSGKGGKSISSASGEKKELETLSGANGKSVLQFPSTSWETGAEGAVPTNDGADVSIRHPRTSTGLDPSILSFDDPTNAAAAMMAGRPALDLAACSTGFSSTFNAGMPPSAMKKVEAFPSVGPSAMAATPGVLSGLSEVPFGAESSALEYIMLSFMLNGIDPSLLSSGTTPPLETNGNPTGDGSSSAANGARTSSAAPHMGIDYGSPHLTAPMGSYQNFLPADAAAVPTVVGAPNVSASYSSGNGNGSGAAAPDAVIMSQPFAAGSESTAARVETGEAVKLHAAQNPLGPGGGYQALEVPSPDTGKAKETPPAHASGSIKPNEEDREQDSSTNDTAAENASVNPKASADTGQRKDAEQRPQVTAVDQHWRQRITKIYKDDIKPFPYTEGYHFLLKFATENFQKAEVLRIVRALAIFRPSLIALQMPMAEDDETFVERSIQRTILEFEKLISFSGTPTVVWRRTCEICVVGAEFSMLTQWSRDDLLGKYIYQFLDSNSTLEYWEKFALHAFENTSQSVMTTCNVISAEGKPIKCAACFSIKRDVFDLPCLIVGNFLPCLG
ncbi:hypothetical protein K437DRAFT_255383 [Tilletiaria anomala UBC 951]|uniref:Transcription activator of gluconeogenesis ERT1 n=1 Tax=Tilletiaria anomala (strain ATCC 24038 / CBS 436.72 / UBC 951) TaxID=1037660 RepID=A0A066W686_TILAU|nr:uncharacterized protein K437DRAFT_255383 [Tilletiaria anomala UBC 951]KDN49251.1 hypothetical protein K437DRAFT_255383 [Tilletiaria anomala UBC 951]